ncbi:hypothetical protein Tco_0513892 [Tanacetum coccineum]
MGIQTQRKSDDEDLMYETGVYDYPEGFTRPSVSISTAEPITTAGEGVSTARAIPEEVSTAEPDIDVTLAEALIDEELALRLHAEEQAEFERLQKERAEQEEASRLAIYKAMDNIQAMIEADEQLATRVQTEEQELYSIEEKSRLLVEMIAERKSRRLFDLCGIHVLLMDTGIVIHVLVEKRYPLAQEMLLRMLSRKLEVDNESEMAFELLRFTRSQIEK